MNKLKFVAPVVGVAAAATSLMTPTVANAQGSTISSYCTNTTISKIGTVSVARLHVHRVCEPEARGWYPGGAAHVGQGFVVIDSSRDNNSYQIRHVTAHEVAHMAEWNMTPADRSHLYSYLGVRTNGNYFSLATSSGKNLTDWRGNPRERLAESVAQCLIGPTWMGNIKLVPISRCKPFIRDFTAAVDRAKTNGSMGTTPVKSSRNPSR